MTDEGVAHSVLAAGEPKDEKEFAAAIMEVGKHLKINKMLARDLSRLLFDTGDDVIVSLLELLAQPDPYKGLKDVLRRKADEHLEKWATGDVADFGHWVKSANFCFHEVNNLLRGNGYGLEKLATEVVQGVRHYWYCPENYGAEDIKNFALVTAVTELSALNEAADDEDGDSLMYSHFTGSITSTGERSTIEGHDHFNCRSLASQTIKDLVAKEPAKVPDIINVILKHNARTDETILHYLGGGHGSLLSGAL